MKGHLFFAGVPATGKTRVGEWLSQHGYIHIDAEVDGGIGFDLVGIHPEWNAVIATGRADRFVQALAALQRPVIINWGFPVEYLYVVKALQAAGVATWWFRGERRLAREAFVRRYLDGRGPHPANFDPQMDAIEQHWFLIESVFTPRFISGLAADGSQREPADMWAEMQAASN